MNKKKKLILEAAIKCFAEKGYHATSIQEIVDRAGIAKGSLYFYFKSKEDLLLSLLKYYYDLLRSTVNVISQDPALSSRERLVQQLQSQFKFLTENKDFIKMLMHESSLHSNESFKQFGMWVHAQCIIWYYQRTLDIYGEEIKPYAVDMAFILNAVTQQFFSYSMIFNRPMDLNNLVRFLQDHMDDTAYGLIKRKKPPLIEEKLIDEFSQGLDSPFLQEVELDLEAELEILKQVAESLSLTAKKKNEVLSCIRVMQEGADKKDGKIIVKAMILYLKNLEIAELLEHLEMIEKHC